MTIRGPRSSVSIENDRKDEADDSKDIRLSLRQRLTRGTTTWTLLFLVVMIVVFSVWRPTAFASVANVQNIMLDTSILLILATGACFVTITAGIDLSVGAVLVFSGIMGAQVMSLLGGGPGTIVVGLIAALAAGVLWGLVNGLLVAILRIPAFIATLGTLGAATGLGLVVTGGLDVRDVPTELVELGNDSLLGQIPYPIVVSAIVVVTASIVLHRTVFGRHTFAIGSNAESSRRAGINVERHLMRVYALAGMFSGLAGFVSLARFGTTTISGHVNDNFQAITAVVLGGTSLFGGIGTIFGTVVGAFIPTVLNNGLVILGVQPYWQQVAVGVILVAAVFFDRLRRSQSQK